MKVQNDVKNHAKVYGVCGGVAASYGFYKIHSKMYYKKPLKFKV